MELTVREMKDVDAEKIVNYFVDADLEFLKGMGASKEKLPSREDWTKKLSLEARKVYGSKELYYIIWLYASQPIGHSNVDNIQYGESARMHLHMWGKDTRKRGLGMEFLKLTIPLYFEKLKLKKLICEPYANNIAPNRTLHKFGFQFIKSYDTVPGPISFFQTVNRYELTAFQFNAMKAV